MNRVGPAFGFSLLTVILIILDVIQWTILIWVILSWILFFTAQSRFRFRNRGLFNVLFQLNEIFTRFTYPILQPFRRILPPHKTAGIDWSPLLLLLVIIFLKRFLIMTFYGP